VVTTLVAYIDPDTGQTWVGADSRATAGQFILPTVARKFRKVGRWWIGVAGNYSASDLIDHNAAAVVEAGQDHRLVAAAIQKMFADAGWKKCEDHSGAPCYEQYYILARKGHIFSVSGAGSVCRIETGVFAEGSGREYALGALNALLLSPAREQLKGDDMVRRALNAAACYDPSTGEPFSVHEVCE
jgi:ATP-dependent protease HslVU (ClpYQ) peptidase subunit